MQPPPYPNSPPEKAQVNASSMQTKPGDGDSLPLMPLYNKAASQKELPARPQEQEMKIVPLNSTSAPAPAPAPTPSPNPPLPTYHADNRPMSRLAPLNTRNLHNSLLIYPPPQSVQQQHQRDKYATQDRSADATPTESIPPQYYSPFSPPEKPYAHLSMQLPYGAATSPVVHREVSPPFAELPAATALGTYRAYSPALGITQRPSNSNSPQLRPVELASPYNRRPQSIPLVPGGAFPSSTTHESERTLSPPPPLFETRKQHQARTLSPSPHFESRQQQRVRSLSPSPQFESRQQPMGNLPPSPPQFDNKKKHQHT